MAEPRMPRRSPAAGPGDAGEPGLVAGLLTRHVPGLRMFVRAHMTPTLRRFEQSTDLVQSVCREVLEHADTFAYHSEPEFRAWLWVAALNKLRDRVRYDEADKRDCRRLAGATAGGGLDDLVIDARSPSEAAVVGEQAGLLAAAFTRLPEDYREVITLSHIRGLTHAVIAERLGCSETAARSLLCRALARLGTLLATSPGRHGR